jgi:predicted DNA-binding protein YlxM (UPF0122 family)
MTKNQIERAIVNAGKGIAQYEAIMNIVNTVDVSKDKEFQRLYNNFYRVRQRSTKWYREYYSLMELSKGNDVSFNVVLDTILKKTGNVEASFSSKLVATLNPERPVWDKYVLQNTKHHEPSPTDKSRVPLIKTTYRSISKWYETFLKSADGQLCVKIFDERMPSNKFTNLKKLDFVLWQTRPEP